MFAITLTKSFKKKYIKSGLTSSSETNSHIPHSGKHKKENGESWTREPGTPWRNDIHANQDRGTDWIGKIAGNRTDSTATSSFFQHSSLDICY